MINWKKQVFEFERYGCVADIHSVYRQRTVTNKRKNPKKIKVCEILFTTKNIQQQKFDSADINKDQLNQ